MCTICCTSICTMRSFICSIWAERVVRVIRANGMPCDSGYMGCCLTDNDSCTAWWQGVRWNARNLVLFNFSLLNSNWLDKLCNFSYAFSTQATVRSDWICTVLLLLLFFFRIRKKRTGGTIWTVRTTTTCADILFLANLFVQQSIATAKDIFEVNRKRALSVIIVFDSLFYFFLLVRCKHDQFCVRI